MLSWSWSVLVVDCSCPPPPLPPHSLTHTYTAAPRRELYIPPPPPEDEASIFETMAAGLNFDKYDEIPVEVTGRDPPRNIKTFEECNFFETTMSNIRKCNYVRPTPVQKFAIPIVTQGRDLMACAQTGSGKTVSAWCGGMVYIACGRYNPPHPKV